MLVDADELFEQSKSGQIHVDGHVDGVSETTTGTINYINQFHVNKVKR